MQPRAKELANILLVILAVGFLFFLFERIYLVPALGESFAAYWSFGFFVMTISLILLLRDAFSHNLRPINFLNRRYYKSPGVLIALILILPVWLFFWKVLLNHFDGFSGPDIQKADAVFIGEVKEVTKGPFNMVKFDVIHKMKGGEDVILAVETGLLEPKNCFFTIHAGDIFIVYMSKDITSGYLLTCSGMKLQDQNSNNEME